MISSYSVIKLSKSKSTTKVSCSNFLDVKFDTVGTLNRLFFQLFTYIFDLEEIRKTKLERNNKFIYLFIHK